jgi:tRNA pseudouridine(55) synthase
VFFFIWRHGTVIMMKAYDVIWKEVGETPLEATEKYRAEAGLPATVPLAYAGRLDPMADGLLLILIGDTCKRQTLYHGLDKQYEVDFLFGCSTDTGDGLGIVTPGQVDPSLTCPQVAQMATSLTGVVTLPFPAFSAKPVRGRPLHEWAVRGELSTVEIPQQTSRVYGWRFQTETQLRPADLLATLSERINRLAPVTDLRKAPGRDFRRVEIMAAWKQYLESQSAPTHFPVVTAMITASSGTYMRSLAIALGERLGSGALALRITRTRIGRFHSIYRDWGYWQPDYRRTIHSMPPRVAR